MEEYHGIWTWREKWSRRAGYHSKITSSKLKRSPPLKHESSKVIKWPTWMNKEFLTNIKHRKAAAAAAAAVQVVEAVLHNPYRACNACRDSVSKVKAQPIAYGKRCAGQQGRLLQVYKQQQKS